MRKLIVLLVLIASCQSPDRKPSIQKNRLVIGIIVDQMRQEYLYRYNTKFGEGGFKRLMRDGFVAKNAHYNYIPTKTAPGHASVYTGTTPAVHGIIGNSWYDRRLGRELENVEDTLRQCFSPVNLLATTITDELRLSNQNRSKVIGVSIKDRGAILPAGHNPTGAFWYNEDSGEFISSNYYKEPNPDWLRKFNSRSLADSLLSLTWNTLFPIEEYTESTVDNTLYETVMDGKETPTFPYNLAELREKKSKIIKSGFGPQVKKSFKLLPITPFGNTITTEIALAALEGEEMGKDEVTDFLAISYSSTDKAGHAFGPQSIEVEDVYLRLDKELERLLNALDEKVGKDNYLIFLTADHAVGDVPAFLTDQKIPAGLIPEDDLKENLNTAVSKSLGAGEWVANVGNEQVFLDRVLLSKRKVPIATVQQLVIDYLQQQPGIANAYPSTNFFNGDSKENHELLLQRGYHRKRSGDVLMIYEPGWMAHDPTGTSHGSGYTYDTHVPMLWFGWHVEKGTSSKRYSITDVAPTLSVMLDIKFPSGATGTPIEELLK